MIIVGSGKIKKANCETKIVVLGPLRKSLFLSAYSHMTFSDVSSIM